MTSSRTILIESNQLFRQGLKHLLADTRFAVDVEFGTMEQALANAETAATSGLVIMGQVSKEPGDLTCCGTLIRTPASWCSPAICRWMPCATR